LDPSDVPDLPARPTTSSKRATPSSGTSVPTAAEIDEQARLLKQYEDKQRALKFQREAEERQRAELAAQQQHEFEQRQRDQAEAQRLAQEQLLQQQQMMFANQQQSEMEQQLLAMRGQFERDQIFLEQYDRVSKYEFK
jgi:hypothetical protein